MKRPCSHWADLLVPKGNHPATAASPNQTNDVQGRIPDHEVELDFAPSLLEWIPSTANGCVNESAV